MNNKNDKFDTGGNINKDVSNNNGGDDKNNNDVSLSIKDIVCSFKSLYKAMHKCKKNVMWKDSVAGFVKNGMANCLKLHRDLMSGKYKISKYSIFEIHEPKRRTIVSTRMVDRVFQRSLSENYLYDEITKSFIYDNHACQKGKGTMFAKDRMKYHLRKYYNKYGNEGYVLKCDIENYFGSTKHEHVKRIVIDKIEYEWVKECCNDIIDSFKTKENPDRGMALGSEITQLFQLGMLDPTDHKIKEFLKIKHYVRYMDDFILIHHDKEHLKYCKEIIEQELDALDLKLNDKKTQIHKIEQGIKYIGFTFFLTETGKVQTKVNKKNMSNAKRRYRRMKGLVEAGKMTRDEVDACYEAWRNHAEYSTDKATLLKMDRFYYNLWNGEE